jgi:hypothetical protein
MLGENVRKMTKSGKLGWPIVSSKTLGSAAVGIRGFSVGKQGDDAVRQNEF